MAEIEMSQQDFMEYNKSTRRISFCQASLSILHDFKDLSHETKMHIIEKFKEMGDI